MENRIQQLVTELSKNERVQNVIHEVHILQNKLNSEMTKTLSKFKKSATDIEKNILNYRKQLVAQKNKIEKELRAKAEVLKSQPVVRAATKKAAAAKKTTTKATSKKTASKATAKKTTRRKKA